MTNNEVKLFNTKIICEGIQNKDIELALIRMKKNDFDENKVFKSLIKSKNISYLESSINLKLLDLNKVSQKTFEVCLYYKNNEALTYLLKEHHIEVDPESFYLSACSKNLIDALHISIHHYYKYISIPVYIEGILYCHFMKNNSRDIIPEYIRQLLLEEGVSLDFNIFRFVTLKPLILKYDVFSYNCLVKSAYNGSLGYLKLLIENKEKLPFSFNDYNHSLLRKAILSDNQDFTKILLEQEEVINSKEAFQMVNKIKNYKSNQTINIALKTLNLHQF